MGRPIVFHAGLKSKTCPKCGIEKPIERFGVVRSQRIGHRYTCKDCCNAVRRKWRSRNLEKVRVEHRDEYTRNRNKYLEYFKSDKRRRAWFRWKLDKQFGITVQDFERMTADQDARCAICRQHPEESNGHRHKHRLHVDHDHKTGVVRGLLCNTCNMGLGAFGDDQERLKSAIAYLEKGRVNAATET